VCPKWKAQQKILWAEVQKETGRWQSLWKIRDLFAEERFFVCLFITSKRPIRSGRYYVQSVCCLLSAQWRHVASSTLPSAQACPKNMWCTLRELQRKVSKRGGQRKVHRERTPASL